MTNAFGFNIYIFSTTAFIFIDSGRAMLVPHLPPDNVQVPDLLNNAKPKQDTAPARLRIPNPPSPSSPKASWLPRSPSAQHRHLHNHSTFTMRLSLSVVFSVFAAATSALSTSGNRLLVVLNDVADKSAYTQFFGDLAGESDAGHDMCPCAVFALLTLYGFG